MSPNGDLERSLAGWALVREIPTTLNLPTLLDIDPAAARGGDGRRVGSASVATPQTDERTCDESRAAGLALARSRRPRAAHRPVRADDDGRLLRRGDGRPVARRSSSSCARCPTDRAYLVFAGLEQAIGDLLKLAFSPEQIEAIRQWPEFRQVDPAVMDSLASLRFEGDVWSVPEGTVVFPGETLLRVTAPLPQAQWVETHLLASLAYPTLVASKAARMVVGGRRPVALRVRRPARAWPSRGHAGRPRGLPRRLHRNQPRRGRSPPGHSRQRDHGALMGPVVRARKPRRSRPSRGSSRKTRPCWSTPTTRSKGVRHAAAIEPPVRAIRIDSGDLASLARQARAILDQLGRPSVKIIASGDLDEYKIAQLVARGRPVDGFGVGTELITSRDAPALAMVYKLVELEGRASSSSVRARRRTRWPSRSFGAKTCMGSFGVIT